MNKQSKQDEIEKIQRLINLYQAQIARLAVIPDDLPGEFDMYADWFGIEIPYDFALLVEIRRKLGRDWKFHKGWVDETSGYRWVKYLHKQTGADLGVIMIPNREGATCRRVQVGVRQYPVYQMVCE